MGLLTATALVALVGDIRRFPSGRHFASFLGLTPKEDSSASRRRLGAISKQGDVYVRMLLIHGARSVLLHAKSAGAADVVAAWARATQQRRGHNVAAVAVANKLARIVWAVWTHQRPFAADYRRHGTPGRRQSPRLPRRTAPSSATMAHRSDRRGETPITTLALEVVASDWPPARGFP